MVIEEASAKIRTRGVVDEEDDYALPIYAERIPVRTAIGELEPRSWVLPGVDRPQGLANYAAGELLGTAVRRAHAQTAGR